MLSTIFKCLAGTGIFFLLGLGFLVHICSKSKYSVKYESTKRKFEIYPNDKSQTPNKRRQR